MTTSRQAFDFSEPFSINTYCACVDKQEQQQWCSSRGTEGLPVRMADPSGTPSPVPGSSNFFFC